MRLRNTLQTSTMQQIEANTTSSAMNSGVSSIGTDGAVFTPTTLADGDGASPVTFTVLVAVDGGDIDSGPVVAPVCEVAVVPTDPCAAVDDDCAVLSGATTLVAPQPGAVADT